MGIGLQGRISDEERSNDAGKAIENITRQVIYQRYH